MPWEIAKSFDGAAVLAPFVSGSTFADLTDIGIRLTINGEVRQQGFTGEMLFTVNSIIAAVSQYTTLRIGDLIYTGTPQGVGAVHPGDNLRATLEGHELLNFDIR
ncbi:MAG: fumarylacetoacetate hydrolase family protein [Alistipes sp.]